MAQKIYRNSTPITHLGGQPLYLPDIVDACLYGRLNLNLVGDTGSGKTQLAKDAMGYFGDKSIFVLGRNDMDTRELFQQINLGKLNTKPQYQLEPIVNPENGEVEWYYPQPNEAGIFTPKRLTKEQTDRVRKSLETIAGNTASLRELTSKINTRLCVVDELPNCVPAVRAQLFNMFDGFIEVGGKAYPFGNHFSAVYPNGDVKLIEGHMEVSDLQKMRAEGIEIKSDSYSIGIATGNMGQRFTESSNDIGRALRDRMHVTIDVDHFHPQPYDTLAILDADTNPRVSFSAETQDESQRIIEQHGKIKTQAIPAEKLITALYFVHGLDHCNTKKGEGSKRKMKEAWPTELPDREQTSVDGLVLPLSMRAAKSVLRLSQSLDYVASAKGAQNISPFDSMLQAYRLVAPYSGVLYEPNVHSQHSGDHYAAINSVIANTQEEFTRNADNLSSGADMVQKGKLDNRAMDKFKGRWQFMRNLLEGLVQRKDVAIEGEQ